MSKGEKLVEITYNMVKLNTYTICKDLKRTGYGGVIRNN